MNEGERAQRGLRAEAALKEFLSPAFGVAYAEYMARMAEIAAAQPWETAKISKLATAARVVREVEAQIISLVRDGEAARAEMTRQRKIESIPEERRKLLGLI